MSVTPRLVSGLCSAALLEGSEAVDDLFQRFFLKARLFIEPAGRWDETARSFPIRGDHGKTVLAAVGLATLVSSCVFN